MECKNCQLPIENSSRFCPYCGKKQRGSSRIIFGIGLTIILFLSIFYMIPFPTKDVSNDDKLNSHESNQLVELRMQLIEEAQQTVYTVYAEHNQGSAFLYDDEGSVITNAHVVEGSLSVTVKTADNREYIGKVIGYSNEIDVALIHVPELIGTEPFPLDKENESKVGLEVIALGTPLGLENTASFGYLTGVNRTFHLPPHTFENVYQISAPIEPGNSGGPLISVQDKKIIAINSAKRVDADNIAFSIPLHQVVSLADQWAANPMDETEIASLFYDENGNYYYDLLWSLLEHYYFDGGYFLDDENYHHYWLYDDIHDLWEQYYHNWYNDEDLNDDEWDNENWYDDEWNDYNDPYWNDYDSWEDYNDPDWDDYDDWHDDDDYWDDYDTWNDNEDWYYEEWDEFEEWEYDDLEAEAVPAKKRPSEVKSNDVTDKNYV